jgi:hypothetical protein|tara:strand:- start:153 stop:443 length:291 start_codon:yes stop_codon:yes gene_type:complete
MTSADGSKGLKEAGRPGRIGCNSCKYFYITWNKKLPYGCRAMGFISEKLPCIDVVVIEGRDCLSFEEKNAGSSANKASQKNLNMGKDGNKKINVKV